MTREERLKSCSICRNREMNMQQGIVCRLTGTTAAFEGSCDDFSRDEAEAKNAEEKRLAVQNSTKISGWLTFFLWVGLGVGGLGSLIFALYELYTTSYSVLYILLRGGTALMLAAVAGYAIYAFYKRRPNAVAIAKTYIAMIVIDGIIGWAMMAIVGEYGEVKSVVRQFVWGSIWYTYLTHSTQVSDLFPEGERTWEKLEKYALLLFTICYLTLLSMVYAQSSTNILLNDHAYIEQAVAAIQADMPMEISDNVEISAIEYADNTLHYSYRITSVVKSDLKPDYIAEFARNAREEALEGWPDVLAADPFISMCCSKRLNIRYSYFDSNDEFLYDVAIAPEDYSDMLDNPDLRK